MRKIDMRAHILETRCPYVLAGFSAAEIGTVSLVLSLYKIFYLYESCSPLIGWLEMCLVV